MSRPSVSSDLTPLRIHLGGALLVVSLSCALFSPAIAAPSGRDALANAPEPQWTLGGLAYGLPAADARPDDRRLGDHRLSDLNNKMRIGASLFPAIEGYATVRSWIGPSGSDGGGRSLTSAGGVMGGVLIDVPLGSFVFTPSFGASLGPTNLPRGQRDAGATTEFRSQLELGYVFDNKSRFSLGYSRIATDAAAADSAAAPNNVFGFYYRLPFGGP